ncbi:NUC091 domain-containing protein [Fomitopsis serialis]|uniref:NUC091 domain-containing protein n=1 Tax=Fomitopsis serialis TaxID=139415 RepID=UPI002008A703|nr:NUC091 domain-containing protein [Neoantrodia serialis]KAH9926424.1 NUC091 domain-containing protein [Neoantrodia serialis]
MAPSKKAPASSKARSSSSAEPHLKKVKGENFYRNAKASRAQDAQRRQGRARQGRQDHPGRGLPEGEDETLPGRVQPDRRWFGNTRVISQTALDHFRTSLSGRQSDPYSVLLRRNKLPMALLDDAQNRMSARYRSHIVETEPFKETFGPKAQRKKPRLDVGTFEELVKQGDVAANEAEAAKSEGQEGEPVASTSSDFHTHADIIEPIYAKGTSRRIYGELYKVIDSSDVILHILDARDPMGTLCESVLEFIRKEKAHKQVVLIINKCDLVPNWVTARYIQHLTPRYPTLAFHASPNHSFGKGSLIQLLRQFSQLHSDKKQISVGFVGYPNVGKSSVINTLKSGKVCTVAPVPGETKVWQYITLTKRIYLIDCPGITSTVLKGVVRVEALATPSEHIPALMARVKPVYLSRTYNVPLPDPDDPSKGWEPEALLDKLGRMKGRLLKGGEPDHEAVAKILLSDWVRGRIPFFVRRRRRRRGWPRRARGSRRRRGSIMQKNTFVGEDVRPLEVEDEAGVDGGAEDDEGEAEDDVEDGVAGDEDGKELGWNDVFKGDSTASIEETATPSSEVEDEEEEWEGEGEEKPKKDGRMTTNKRKATNFYSSSNVKNKNRHKAALMKSLPTGKRAGGTRGRRS